MRHNYQNTSGKRKIKIPPQNLMWCIVKSVPGYSNILKKFMFCLHEKYEEEELLNERSEIVSKCQDVNKFLLYNYKSNDWCISQLIKPYYSQIVIK